MCKNISVKSIFLFIFVILGIYSCRGKDPVVYASEFNIINSKDNFDGRLHKITENNELLVSTAKAINIEIVFESTESDLRILDIDANKEILKQELNKEDRLFRKKYYRYHWFVYLTENTDRKERKAVIGIAKANESSFYRSFNITQGIRAERPKQPIEYMAEYNVNDDATGFVNTHEWNAGGYFTISEAENIKIAGYHLPTVEEMNGVVPAPRKNKKKKSYVEKGEYSKIFTGVLREAELPPLIILDNDEAMTVKGETVSCTSIYGITGAFGTSLKASYALRFDNDNRKYFSAFRYSIIPPKGKEIIDLRNRNDYLLEIRVRYLGPNSKLHADDNSIRIVADEEFWRNNSGDDIIRYIPNCSMTLYPDDIKPSKLEDSGRYWLKSSSDTFYGLKFRYLDIGKDRVGMGNFDMQSKHPVRLFSNS